MCRALIGNQNSVSTTTTTYMDKTRINTLEDSLSSMLLSCLYWNLKTFTLPFLQALHTWKGGYLLNYPLFEDHFKQNITFEFFLNISVYLYLSVAPSCFVNKFAFCLLVCLLSKVLDAFPRANHVYHDTIYDK